MPRPRLGLRSALSHWLTAASALLAAAISSVLLGCTGSSDPTTTVSAGATGTYIHATMTLLDTAAPCIPGIACAPEFYNCDGDQGYTLPRTWTLHADEASAGGVSPYSSAGGIGSIVLAVRGTDTSEELGISLEVRLDVDTVARTWTSQVGATTRRTFVNVDARCTRLNPSLDPVTLFGYVDAEPSDVAVSSVSLAPSGDIAFATQAGANLTGNYIEGTFSFTAANQQEFGQVYVGRVRVDGCFRVQLPLVEQGVELDPSVTAGCP